MVIIAILFTAFTKSNAQSIESPYEAGTWEGFRSAAVTYTFDDGLPNQITYAVPLFDSLGFKATFYVIVNKVTNWATFKNLAQKGYEIGSHTMSHPDSLAGSPTEEYELKNSQAQINNHIPGNQCITIAYPLCRQGDIPLISRYYIAGRKCQGNVELKTPKNFYGISSIGCGSKSSLNSVHELDSMADLAVKTKGWCVFLAHDIVPGRGYSPLDPSIIKGNLNYLDQNRDKFWVATFSNVVRYIKERDSVNIKSISNQENSITLNMTDNLPDSIYNVPITIRRPLPDGWDTAYVERNDSLLKSSMVKVNNEKYVMFDAIPDKGNIQILKGITSVCRNGKQTPFSNLRVWFDKSGLSIHTDKSSISGLMLTLFDLRGNKIGTFKLTNDGGTDGSIALPVRIQEHCTYIARITDGKTTLSNIRIANNF